MTEAPELQALDVDPLNKALSRESIGRLLKRVMRLHDQRLRAQLDAQGYQDVHPRHFAVFSHLDIDGTHATDLAQRAGMTRQSMGELVADLVGLGYLEQREDLTDRRSKVVRLTPRGVRHVRDARRTIGELNQAWEKQLGTERMLELRAMLEELAATGYVEPRFLELQDIH